ncbi:PCRF domain-containing protein [Candidatus Woesearchaeota archaeon]|nr:PCRF domain-containing protein [Candidatus Woesearchaeota archaeon]
MAQKLESIIAKLRFMDHEMEQIYLGSNTRERIEDLERLLAGGSSDQEAYREYGTLAAREARYKKLREEADFALLYLDEARRLQNGTLEDSFNFADGVIEQIRGFMLENRFTGNYDTNNALITLQPGAGDKEMLKSYIKKFSDAYSKFAGSKGFAVEVVDEDESEITLRVVGENAYAYFRGEHGSHKIIYFDGSKKQTNYLTVVVDPEIIHSQFELKDEELSLEFIAASTKGGQHANRSSTGVRVTHIPTKLTAVSRGRSQNQNKINAMKVLYSRVVKYLDEQSTKIGEKRADPSRGGYMRVYDFTRNYISDSISQHFTHDIESFFKGGVGQFVYAFHGLRSLIE